MLRHTSVRLCVLPNLNQADSALMIRNHSKLRMLAKRDTEPL
jgi:hypothetical protein